MPARLLADMLREARPRLRPAWNVIASSQLAPVAATCAFRNAACRAVSPARLRASLHERHRGYASQTEAAATPSKQTGPPPLPAPSPRWTWQDPALNEAAEQVALRKAAFSQEEFDELRSLREQSKTLSQRVLQEQRSQKQAGEEVRAAMARIKEHGKDGQEPDAALQAELEKARAAAADARRQVNTLQKEIADLVGRSLELRLKLPNSTHAQTPPGPEANARVLAVGGPAHLLPPGAAESVQKTISEAGLETASDAERDHLAVAERLAQFFGGVDLRSGVTSTGSSWPYLVGTLAKLEHAIAQFALHMAVTAGYTIVSTPEVVKTDIAARCGFNPRDEQASQTYFVSTSRDGSAADELCLVGTAEIPLAALVAGRSFRAAPASTGSAEAKAPAPAVAQVPQPTLPLKLVALSHAFRAEAGARGADTRGLYRVHQFSKAELFVVCEPSQSAAMLDGMRALQCEFLNRLGLPYRVLDMPSEELGASAYRKLDIEAWMPGRGSWGEISSTSDCTDYQSRRLHIKVDVPGGETVFAHTLNGTAAAVPRLIVALLENYGLNAQGQLRLPRPLMYTWVGAKSDPHVEWVDVRAPGEEGEDADARRVRSATIRKSVPKHLRKSPQKAAARKPAQRAYSTSASPPPPTPPQSAVQSAIARVRQLAERTGTDPASLVIAFLVLHELTAALPLLALFYLFSTLGLGATVLHWLLPGLAQVQPGTQDTASIGGGDREIATDSTQQFWLTAKLQGWLEEGMRRAERYGRRKGYFGFEKSDASGEPGSDGGAPDGRTVLAGAFADAVAAYVVVKMLLPLRIGASIALAPAFSRAAIEPVKRLVRRIRSRRGQ